MLLGPHQEGAQAIVPPGVLVRTPEEEGTEYDNQAWRSLIWHFQLHDHRSIDARRPATLQRISSQVAVRQIRRHAPEHALWLEEQLRQQSRAILLLLDYGAPGEDLGALRAELDDLLLDCVAVYGETWVRENLAPRPVELR